MKLLKFIIIAELETKGYIIGTAKSLNQAKKLSDKIFGLANQYSFNDLHSFHSCLKHYKCYEIKGNATYIKCKECISNGLLSIYILEIDLKDFSVDLYIKERASTSYAAFSENDSIPEILVYAN